MTEHQQRQTRVCHQSFEQKLEKVNVYIFFVKHNELLEMFQHQQLDHQLQHKNSSFFLNKNIITQIKK